MNKKIKVKCPQCSTEFFYYDSEFRPFCSDRCQKIDLGHWFQESYVVPAKDQTPEESIEENQNDIERDEENNESEYN